jgi:glyoxylase-like metal-dependent hydrolase (beta-lactamase superfamily II)
MVRIARLGWINLYLVPDEDGITVIDTGIGGSTKQVLAAAERLGAPIKRIALTHAHGDHVGSVDALVAALPGVEVLISARDAKILAGDKSAQPGEPADAKLGGSFPKKFATTPTRTIAEGDRVGSLEVYDAPGHTPGHVAFLDPRDGTIYAGDVFTTLNGVATTAKTYPGFPLAGPATWHKATELDSARKLRALDPKLLCVGHGKPVESPGAAMDRAIARGC